MKSYKRRVDKLQQILSGDGLQAKEVAALLFLDSIHVRHLLLELERDGMIHVSGYSTETKGRPGGIYRWGKGGKRPPSPGRKAYEHKRRIKQPTVPVEVAQQLSMQRILAGLNNQRQEKTCSQ